MSTGTRILRADAYRLVRPVMEHLTAVCERVELAGSLRRGAADVGDIEIVCIPNKILDLFGSMTVFHATIDQAMETVGYAYLKGGEAFKQYDLGPCKLDLFITTAEKWGVIFTIRTGPADFSHRLVTPRKWGGLLPSNLKVRDGRIWNGSEAMETPEEADVFRVLGLEWIQPERRK